MNREILFRAKHIHVLPKNKHLNRQWIEGYLSDKYYINSPEFTGDLLIDEKTIGQYTGLNDNGRKIFEGDVCIVSNNKIDEEDGCFVVEWCADSARFVLDGNGITVDFDNYFGHECEVVGNIFDNPDLTGD